MGRPAEFESIYLDACALIAVIQNEPGSEPIKDVLARASAPGKKSRLEIVASTIILVEVRGQRRGVLDPQIEQKVLALLDGPAFVYVETTRKIARRARGYVATHNLNPMDAIHLASAVEGGAEVMWSLDKGFKSFWGTDVDGVWVDQPYATGPPTIPGT